MQINTPSSEPQIATDSCDDPSMLYAVPLRIAVSALLILPVAFSIPAAGFTCNALNDDAKRAMKAWQVPGMALGVVEGGQIILRRTYGIRDTDNRLPVTTGTVFGTGSLTKSFTALGIAIAAAEGRLSIDRPVRQILDYFPGNITLRHLLSHTSGWPRHDALWYLDTYSRQNLPRRLALLTRFGKAGSTFQYNNVPFAAAGIALSVAIGETWDTWITSKILAKTGMMDTVTSLSGFRDIENRASPYFPGQDGRISLPLRDTDPVAPAAGLYSPLEDMLRYTAAMAHKGQIDDRQVLPALAVQALLRRETRGYGLGLRLSSWRGEPLAFHPGFIDGYGARLSLLPDRKSGVIVLTNMSGETPVARIVSQIALDCLTAAPRTDWVAHFGGERKPQKPKPPSPATIAPDRLPHTYTGRYIHPAYGPVSFTVTAETLSLIGRFHGREFELSYAGNDSWRLADTHWPLREGLIFSFSGLAGGEFATVSAPIADGPTYRRNAGPLVFHREPLSSPAPTPDK